MANWEKLIEERYAKKNKISVSTLYEMIDLELESAFQDGVIQGHSGKRLSTKGKKKAGGDPFDQDPPKERSKSAPAGFGVLEEEGLEEATIRDSRKYYYVNPKGLSGKMWSQIQATAQQAGQEVGDKSEFDDRIFAVQRREDAGDGMVYYFDLMLLPEPVKSKYGLRGLVMQSNAQDSAVGDMQSGEKIFTYSKTNVKPTTTKISWLQTKPEELRAENEHLSKIKAKFIQAGIGNDPEKGLKPATIIIKPTHGGAGSGQQSKFENVIAIDKVESKGAVGDFGLFLLEDPKNPVFTMSHKAIGFERYAALKQTLKELQKTGEGGAAKSFLDTVARKWTEGALKGGRSTKGYYQMVDSADFAKEVVYFIYGTGSRKANSLFVGEITLVKTGENEFTLSVDPSEKTSNGNSECLIYDTLPSDQAYMPIFKSRQGSNGSWVILGDYGASDKERAENRKNVLAELTRMVNVGDDGKPPQRTIEDLEAMSYVIGHEKDELTGAIVITSAKLSVRYYVSPFRRMDGAEEIKFEK